MSLFRTLKQKWIDPTEIAQSTAQWKQEGKTLVTLNGSFDLLHAGHLHIIQEAALQGDLLLVALNTDRSIQMYKSPSRPIIPLKARLEMMAALEMVDYVTAFDETNPIELLRKISPHVHVNGSEYGEACIEAQVVREGGGRLHIVSLVPGLSTSNIVEKIQKQCV